MAERITDKLVKDLEHPAKGNRITYDDSVKGFGIRITANGAKSFILNYRNADGLEKRLTIGPYGRDLWSVDAARKHAGELRKMIGRGEDPLGEKQARRAEETITDLCDRYERDYLPRKRTRSQAEDKALIRRFIKPKMGKVKITAVKHADVDKLHRALAATPFQANRVVALLSKMFTLAEKWELRPLNSNPAQHIERFPEPKRRRYLSAEEMARLTKALADFDKPKAANIVRLLLLTGARRSEAVNATWDQFDLEGKTWTKSGATTKQKTEHEAPLSDAALQLLEGIRANRSKDNVAGASDYIFPGKTPDVPFASINHAWESIRDKAEIWDVRLHDLRHTYASILASAGASLPMIGALLGHTQAATTQRYAHLFRDPMREAANVVGAIVTGKQSADVEPLHKDGAA